MIDITDSLTRTLRKEIVQTGNYKGHTVTTNVNVMDKFESIFDNHITETERSTAFSIFKRFLTEDILDHIVMASTNPNGNSKNDLLRFIAFNLYSFLQECMSEIEWISNGMCELFIRKIYTSEQQSNTIEKYLRLPASENDPSGLFWLFDKLNENCKSIMDALDMHESSIPPNNLILTLFQYSESGFSSYNSCVARSAAICVMNELEVPSTFALTKHCHGFFGLAILASLNNSFHCFKVLYPESLWTFPHFIKKILTCLLHIINNDHVNTLYFDSDSEEENDDDYEPDLGFMDEFGINSHLRDAVIEQTLEEMFGDHNMMATMHVPLKMLDWSGDNRQQCFYCFKKQRIARTSISCKLCRNKDLKDGFVPLCVDFNSDQDCFSKYHDENHVVNFDRL